jgi:hypothetical protein
MAKRENKRIARGRLLPLRAAYPMIPSLQSASPSSGRGKDQE